MGIKVIIAGYRGKMGSTTTSMVLADSELELVGLLDPHTEVDQYQGIPVFKAKEELQNLEADVWVDFTKPDVAFEHTLFALENGFAPVVGTTGFSDLEIDHLVALSVQKEIGGLIAPNFAIGAILLMEFAEKAAQYFPDLEIIELHHNQKKDAPSGTALKTAQVIAERRSNLESKSSEEEELIAGARGADYQGIHIHSVRLPGLVAHQEVLFGGPGEGLTIRHDSYDRQSFMQGVKIGIKAVVKEKQLVYGLENLL